MIVSKIKRFFIGEPLSGQFEEQQRIPKWKALATLSSDALSSVAYATDAMLLVLVGFSTGAIPWSLPIAIAIMALLAILTASYSQTIQAYPNGGGAYTVAKENLGQWAGLIAGASLLIDYILTVAVSVSAGVENMTAAFPLLAGYRELFCGAIIFGIAVMNLRGAKESATVFALPTYFFIFSVFSLLATGAYRLMAGEVPMSAPPINQAFSTGVPMILLLRAFGSGCAALTGVEAISNGVNLFRTPSTQNAKATLVWMSVILGIMFFGITSMVYLYGLSPRPDQTIISVLNHAIFGDTFYYYAIQISTAMILFLAANTSYAGFPWLASHLAHDRYLPRQLASVGDRLVFSNAIIGLSISAMALILVFDADTHRLIPLYLVGAFISFTLSQAGMVIHHLKGSRSKKVRLVLVNGLGALTTGVVLLDIASTKFMQGAWMVVLLIPILLFLFHRIHEHYLAVGRELTLLSETPPDRLEKVKHTVVIPISGIHRGVLEALRYALSIAEDVRACYVEIDPDVTERVKEEWSKWAPDVPFVVLKSPYRSVVQPLIKYIDDVEQVSHDDLITVVVPEFVTSRWWHRLLHNQTAIFIRAALIFKKGKVVTSVRYHLKA